MTDATDRRVPRPLQGEHAIRVQPSFALISAAGWKFATFATQAEVDFALRKLSAAWGHVYIVDLKIDEHCLTLEIRPAYAAKVDDTWFACEGPGDLAAMVKAQPTHFDVFATFKAAREFAAASIQAFADSL